MSVSVGPEGCLRHWCSSTSLRISPLHVEFHLPLPHSSQVVSSAIPKLSPGLSHSTCSTACAHLPPSTSAHRSRPTYYRGCWHVVSRCFFLRYRHPRDLLDRAISFRPKVLYNPKAFFTHAAWLDQGCPHCPKFPTAASRRSLGRVSVPVWLVVLSDQLRIVALVGFYPANKLIRRGLVLDRRPKLPFPAGPKARSGIRYLYWCTRAI